MIQNEFLKGLKVDRSCIDKDRIEKMHKAFDCTSDDFKKACTDFSAIVDPIIDQLTDHNLKMTDRALFDCMQEYLGCKSSDDVYYILTSASFHRFNEIVKLINDRIAQYTGVELASGVGPLMHPIAKSTETRMKLKARWEEIYNEN